MYSLLNRKSTSRRDVTASTSITQQSLTESSVKNKSIQSNRKHMIIQGKTKYERHPQARHNRLPRTITLHLIVIRKRWTVFTGWLVSKCFYKSSNEIIYKTSNLILYSCSFFLVWYKCYRLVSVSSKDERVIRLQLRPDSKHVNLM